MSGYRDHPVSPSGRDTHWAFLHKPFTPDALLVKVRESLDARVNRSQLEYGGAVIAGVGSARYGILEGTLH
jgi:hypothetical protein